MKKGKSAEYVHLYVCERQADSVSAERQADRETV